MEKYIMMLNRYPEERVVFYPKNEKDLENIKQLNWDEIYFTRG